MIEKYRKLLKRNFKLVSGHVSKFGHPADRWQLGDVNLVLDPVTHQPVNFMLEGQAFYPENAADISSRQVANFVTQPPKLELSFSIIVPEDTICYRHSDALDKAVASNDMLRPRMPVGSRRFQHGPRYAPSLAIFGIGLGHHIKPLIEQFDVARLIIVECEAAVMTAGLAGCDWEAVLRLAQRKGIEVKILFHPDPVQCAFAALNELRNGPPSSLIGL